MHPVFEYWQRIKLNVCNLSSGYTELGCHPSFGTEAPLLNYHIRVTGVSLVLRLFVAACCP